MILRADASKTKWGEYVGVQAVIGANPVTVEEVIPYIKKVTWIYRDMQGYGRYNWLFAIAWTETDDITLHLAENSDNHALITAGIIPARYRRGSNGKRRGKGGKL